MNTRPDPRVIVGVDRSIHGLAALRAAAAEAVLRGLPLYAARAEPDYSTDFTEIDAAFADAFGGLPAGLEVHRELLIGSIADALTRRAAFSGDLLVVGDSRPGRLRSFWSGSVTRSCLSKAHCPVMAVPAPDSALAGRSPRSRRRAERDQWQWQRL
jgi:nucleotide-binding universal stress UspA family protein